MNRPGEYGNERLSDRWRGPARVTRPGRRAGEQRGGDAGLDARLAGSTDLALSTRFFAWAQHAQQASKQAQGTDAVLFFFFFFAVRQSTDSGSLASQPADQPTSQRKRALSAPAPSPHRTPHTTPHTHSSRHRTHARTHARTLALSQSRAEPAKDHRQTDATKRNATQRNPAQSRRIASFVTPSSNPRR